MAASAERRDPDPSGKAPPPSGVRADLRAGDRTWALVASRFHEDVCRALEAGARSCLLAHGAPETSVVTFHVAGAFEIPAAARAVLESGRAEAVVGLGAVIRGETPHFDHVCRAVTDGLARLAYESGRPVGFGVLTADTLDQARARAGGSRGNKGWEAALAALEMAGLLDGLAPESRVGFSRLGSS
ncbi:MAG TPA: 6,7-dimethyl-8-ribityllumazine synthase [Gemmatimonadota bacterium]